MNRNESYMNTHQAEIRLNQLVSAYCRFANGWSQNPERRELNRLGYYGGYLDGLHDALHILYDIEESTTGNGTSYKLK